jgi:hypothetical protein
VNEQSDETATNIKTPEYVVSLPRNPVGADIPPLRNGQFPSAFLKLYGTATFQNVPDFVEFARTLRANPYGTVGAGELYEAYVSWAAASGRVMSASRFGRLAGCYLTRLRVAAGNEYIGISL